MIPPTKTNVDNDKASGDLVQSDRHDSTAPSPQTSPMKKFDDVDINNGLLTTVLSGPIRSLSPDAFSSISAEWHDQIPQRRLASIQLDDSAIDSLQTPSPPTRGIRRRWQRFWVHNKGLAYMLIANVFGTLMNATTRLLEIEGAHGKGLHPFQILFARMGITVVLGMSYMWIRKTPHFPFGLPEVRWLLFARGLGGFFGVYGMYYSLLYLPLADAVVITFLAPSLACWACSILIKEPFTRREQIAGLVSLVGVVLIARPTSLFAVFGSHDESDNPAIGVGDAITGNGTAPAVISPADPSSFENVTPLQRLTAVGVALLGVLGSATTFTAIRWIGKRAHPLISVNYFSFLAFTVSVVMQAVLPGVGFLLPASLREWGLLLFLGSCGFVMQFLLAAGLAYEKSSRATNMAYTQMLFALAFDKLFFGHTPSMMSILGSSLILSGAIVVAIQKDPARQQKDSAEGLGHVAAADEESRTGLMSAIGGSAADQDHDRSTNQGVQLQTLR